MKKRTASVASILTLALLATISAPANAEARPERVLEGRYQRARLAESRLSLLDDTPIEALEARPTSGSSAGRGADTKNPMVAFFLSCVIPGRGEVYAGDTTRGRWFLASEAAIWAGFGTFRIQEGLSVDDYVEFAQIFAGAATEANAGYLSDMGDYIRSEGDNSYNQSIRREARSLFPDDLEAQAAYLAENGYYGDLAWDWGDKDRFHEYRELRLAASRSDRNAFYMTGLALLNRALSAIDSAWMARRHNAGVRGEPGTRFSVVPQISDGDVGARATLEVSF
ncbi:MAG: hypothetical protein ABIK85_03315 [Candidatus Eisenbacteria bacterium]